MWNAIETLKSISNVRWAAIIRGYFRNRMSLRCFRRQHLSAVRRCQRRRRLLCRKTVASTTCLRHLIGRSRQWNRRRSTRTTSSTWRQPKESRPTFPSPVSAREGLVAHLTYSLNDRTSRQDRWQICRTFLVSFSAAVHGNFCQSKVYFRGLVLIMMPPRATGRRGIRWLRHCYFSVTHSCTNV